MGAAAAARRAAARLPRLHRQRPGHRHGDVRQRLLARPDHLRARTFAERDRLWAAATRRSTSSTTCSSTSGTSPSGRRCPPTSTTPRCSWSSAAGSSSDATPPGAPRRPDSRPGGARRHRRAPRSRREPVRITPGQEAQDAATRSAPTSTVCGLPSRSTPRSHPTARCRPGRSRRRIGRRADRPNRFAILPMEGWDGTADGRPTDLVRRRWQRFGASGAELIWGGGGRGAPRRPGQPAPAGHRRDHGSTTSPRCASLLAAGPGRRPAAHPLRPLRPPATAPQPRIAYATRSSTPRRRRRRRACSPTTSSTSWSSDFVDAAVLRRRPGFDFVDVKHCHGYLGHECSAPSTAGPLRRRFEGRTRFLREVIAGIRARARPRRSRVRLTAFDLVPVRGRAPTASAYPTSTGPYR